MTKQNAQLASARWIRITAGTSLLAILAAGCGDRVGQSVLVADMPLHLEDHLDAATVEGSELPATIPEPVEWRFDEPQPDWKPAQPLNPGSVPAQMERTGDALRVTASEAGDRQPNGTLNPIIYVDLPDWRREDWSEVVVRARTTSVTGMAVGLSTWEGESPPTATRQTLRGGGSTPVVSDGTVQTYRIRPDWGELGSVGSWRRLFLGFFTPEPGSIDVLSVSVVPTGALYADDPVGQRSISVGGEFRRSLYTHAPGRITYSVRVPDGGRLDVALGLLAANGPVEFRVTARQEDEEATTLFTEMYADRDEWADRTIDLSSFAGEAITLGLETSAAEANTVAFWGSPTLSGARRTGRPNVILYVIDGGWPDAMSVYGYNRRTTPYLERLAAEGVVFEHAYSNTPRTRTSTPSFMTSLQSSVLGNTRQFAPIPAEVRTMAERFHEAGYQTAVFTSNPNAGSPSNLERGVDLMRDNSRSPTQPRLDLGPEKPTSIVLQDDFWSWRDAFPGVPYWVHFQTTDVQGAELNRAPAFAGLYVTAERSREFRQEMIRFEEVLSNGTARASNRPVDSSERAFENAGIDPAGFFEAYRGLYDEAMAHQDYQIARFVDRVRERGEWENTLLVIASDHGIQAVTVYPFSGPPRGPLPPPWTFSFVRGSVTRVPLIFVWPGRIEGGRRIEAPVSMIDLLPTLLDLAGLPLPDVSQGRSLAPLLRGEPGWTPRPVIMDEFEVDPASGQLRGLLDVIDGRWGASMWIGPPPDDPAARRPWPVLVFDIWADPWALEPINEERPDLVEKYTAFLEEQWRAHQALATRFTPGGEVTLTPAQLERLRALGYIR